MAESSDDRASGQEAAWQRFVERARARSDIPFEEHWAAFRSVFADRRAADGPPSVWLPDAALRAESNLGRFVAEQGLASFAELHAWSVRERAAFWDAAIRRLGIVFERPAQTMLDITAGTAQARWLVGARLSCVDSCFTASPDRPAVISGGEGSAPLQVTNYGELCRLVDRVARGLVDAGSRPGDAIALYMPMTLECVAAYLGVLRAGCRVVAIADSFPAPELARRLTLGAATTVITVDRFERAGKHLEPYARVQETGGVRAIVIRSKAPATALRAGDLDWDAFLGSAEPFAPRIGEPYDTITVLFSSGTTGDPKAIPWTQLTPIKCAMDGHFHQDVRPGDVLAWPTNIGWMMGPWLIFAGLINGATIALYQGAPTHSGFVRFVREAGVTILGVVPSLVGAWRTAGVPAAAWPDVRLFSSTGEPSNVQDYLWLMSRSGYRAPVIEYCGGTEIGGGYITGTVLQPASPATFTTPALGLDLVLHDEEHGFVDGPGEGEVYLVPPSIGLSQTLLNRDHDEVYYQGCPAGPGGETLRRHGDRLVRLPAGYYRAQGRADDTMNLGGIKVGSLEIERVLVGHPAVSECAAVGVQVGGEGPERLVVFYTAAAGIDAGRLRQELGRRLAAGLNPLFKIHDVVQVDALPRTASNKLMRRELRRNYRQR